MNWREARRILCQHYKRKKLDLSSTRLQTLIDTAKRLRAAENHLRQSQKIDTGSPTEFPIHCGPPVF
jgi:hypothetical protein